MNLSRRLSRFPYVLERLLLRPTAWSLNAELYSAKRLRAFSFLRLKDWSTLEALQRAEAIPKLSFLPFPFTYLIFFVFRRCRAIIFAVFSQGIQRRFFCNVKSKKNIAIKKYCCLDEKIYAVNSKNDKLRSRKKKVGNRILICNKSIVIGNLLLVIGKRQNALYRIMSDIINEKPLCIQQNGYFLRFLMILCFISKKSKIFKLFSFKLLTTLKLCAILCSRWFNSS